MAHLLILLRVMVMCSIYAVMQRLNSLQKDFIAESLSKVMRDRGHDQERASSLIGIDQGRVCKILKGQFSGLNGAVLKVCNYANIDPKTIPGLKFTDAHLAKFASQFVETWGGSEKECQAVVDMLTAVRDVALERSRLGKEVK
ncbi:MAG: helix-turn-helix transcriptional regulator [Chromatiales bacterium]|nr:helix-turn-helix transcriptional regulator [Chromatiales bacterium]